MTDFEIISPATIKELFIVIKKCGKDNFRFGAGYTDLLNELRKKTEPELKIINLAQVKDSQFTGIKTGIRGLWIGAMTTIQQLVSNQIINREFPVLHQSASSLASTQVRNVATIGGNICTASPSGDVSCALVSLNASCEILRVDGRTRMISIQDFFLGPRKTLLNRDEVLYRIFIPQNKPTSVSVHSGFIKVGTRQSMECSVVSLAFHIQSDKKSKIIKAGLAIGAASPTIRFTESACNFLIDKTLKNISESIKDEFAENVVVYASPISDLRASAWYRKEVLYNISKSVLEVNPS